MAKFEVNQTVLQKVHPVADKLIEVAADMAVEHNLTLGEAALAMALAFGCVTRGMDMDHRDASQFAGLGIALSVKADMATKHTLN